MQLTKNTNGNYNPRQLKLSLQIEKIIDISDLVYSFSEIVDSIDFTSYFAVKESKTGRPRYNPTIILKIILFSFMENGYLSLRNMEKSCKTDIRYMWLLDGMAAPSFATFGNFIRDELTDSIETIFLAIVKLHFIPNFNLKLFLKIFLHFFTFILGFYHIIPKNCVYKRSGDVPKN